MLRREAQAFFSALQFLTRLPVPAWTGWEDGRLDRAAAWFPLVGILVGGAAGAVYMLASLALAPGVAALLAIGAALLLTMGLHEDGLADFTDGVGGGRDREHMLAIMKDSRVGSYGVLALVLSVGLRAASLAALAPMAGAVALIGAHGLSRCLMRLALLRLDYARPEGEAKVAPLSPEDSLPRLALLLALTALALLPFLASAPPGIAFGTILLSLLAGIAMRALMRHRLGGWTGDGIGAVQQASETAFLIGASAWIST